MPVFLFIGLTSLWSSNNNVEANHDYICWSEQFTCTSCKDWGQWDKRFHYRDCLLGDGYFERKWGNTRVGCPANFERPEHMTEEEKKKEAKLFTHIVGTAAGEFKYSGKNGCGADVWREFDFQPPIVTPLYKNETS